MTTFAELIPLALTIAFSPIPLAGLLFMLVAPTGFRSGGAFTAGWVIGIAFALTGMSVLVSLIRFPEAAEPRSLFNAVSLFLGATLTLIGLRQWRDRPPKGASVAAPRWMIAFDSLSPVRAGIVGFLYAAFRQKNLIISVASGLVIIGYSDDLFTITSQVIIFTLIASLSMTLPILVLAIGGSRARTALSLTRQTLINHMSTITSITFMILGVILVALSLASWLS